MHSSFYLNNLIRLFNYFFIQDIMQPPAHKLALAKAWVSINNPYRQPVRRK